MNYLGCLLALLFSLQSYSQASDQQFLPGKLLVKFSQDLNLTEEYVINNYSKGRTIMPLPHSIETLFEAHNIQSVKPVFNTFTQAPSKRRNKPQLNIFLLETKAEVDPIELSKLLSKNEYIDYAEPDYIYKSHCNTTDQLIDDQWYLPMVQTCEAWSLSKGQGQVIAILDTGVDPTHPDLQGQLLPGYDFINDDSDPRDDNMHGTHVAGIAAAKSDNNEGIAGVAPEAKILPVKVLQSNGQGSLSTIALGVEYAMNAGATVINMSLGSPVESLILKDILSQAYNSATLIASAGNDGQAIIEEGVPSLAQYPACYPFVLGVESVQQDLSKSPFSNFDPSGPIEYTNAFGYNYEIKAPGTAILSTTPKSGYRQLNGTSMSSPIVAGAVALLKSYQPNISNEEIFARLIQTSKDGLLQMNAALTGQLIPELHVQNFATLDTLSIEPGDGDFSPDTGEFIGLSLAIKNVGGQAKNVKIKISVGEFEDPSVVSFVTSEVEIGDIGTYGSLTHPDKPLTLRINNELAHNRQIVLAYELSAENTATIVKGELTLVVSSEEELVGIISDERTLAANKSWVVKRAFKITESGILNIPPGTHLRLEEKIVNDGIINGIGTQSNKIYISGPKGIYGGTGEMNFKYTEFTELFLEGEFMYQGTELNFDYCLFSDVIRLTGLPNHTNFFDGHRITVTNSVFRNFSVEINFGYIAMTNPEFDFVNQVKGLLHFEKNNFDNISGCKLIYNGSGSLDPASSFRYNNLSRFVGQIWLVGESFFESAFIDQINFEENNFVSGPSEKDYYLFSSDEKSEVDFENLENNYWGTIDSLKIDEYIIDFWDDAVLPIVDYSPYNKIPSNTAHGLVWKIEINEVDPQDAQLDPLGTETVKFEVFFNRPMDTSVLPLLTFGLQAPRTQNVVSANASWNADGTVWTAYHDIDFSTGDGINSLRVSGAVDDEGVEIPVEDNLRYQFVIQSAGSSSLLLNAMPKVAAVDLDWEAEENADILGYNVYRFTSFTLGQAIVYSDTLRINSDLVLTSTYSDIGGDPDSLYHYMLSTLYTDFIESALSPAVQASPLSGQIDNDNDGFPPPIDCDDNNPNVNPSQQEEPYNGLDDDCDPTTLDDDLDRDGFLVTDDCDDTNANINPDQIELHYNGIDDDCNSATLDDDLDEDGFFIVDDCDDNNADIYPGAEEIPNNGIDEDCDGMDLRSAVHELSNAIISIYPNPTSHLINIKVQGALPYKITLYDLEGRIISIYKNKAKISMESLPRGVYLLELLDLNSGNKLVERIIKRE